MSDTKFNEVDYQKYGHLLEEKPEMFEFIGKHRNRFEPFNVAHVYRIAPHTYVLMGEV